MKYYLTFVKHIKDGTEARECLGITDIITAKATAYNKMGSAMNDPNCDYAFATVCNPLGQNLIQPISFERPIEPTEEHTEEVSEEA